MLIFDVLGKVNKTINSFSFSIGKIPTARIGIVSSVCFRITAISIMHDAERYSTIHFLLWILFEREGMSQAMSPTCSFCIRISQRRPSGLIRLISHFALAAPLVEIRLSRLDLSVVKGANKLSNCHLVSSHNKLQM